VPGNSVAESAETEFGRQVRTQTEFVARGALTAAQ
jgi:hypothetical protein